jgi:hypothetical protein
MNIRFLIYLGFFFAGAIASLLVRDQMMKEANEHLPTDKSFAYAILSKTWLERGEFSRLWGVHRQFFPNSSLRFWYVTLWVLTLSWMFFGLSFLNIISEAFQ